ncbi:hypothetical protein GCM10017788_54120 [Amycolatopsis acidiphila]|nr:hypothetical protein GCM10017788_54120 [Amycolatopsis acidiphila]
MRIVRDATDRDGEACAAIYAPYVTGTAISFEEVPPTPAQMSGRIAATRAYGWLVLEDGGAVIGYAYGHPSAERAAYRWSCETSIYLAPGGLRAGGGRLLYEALLARLAARGTAGRSRA